MPQGPTLRLLASGDGVNYAAGPGNPIEIMDLSFAVQAMSAMYIKDNYKQLGNKVIGVSEEIDDVIARKRLEAWGIEIDSLTDEQKEYLDSWQL